MFHVRAHIVVALIVATLVVCLFSNALFTSRATIISNQNGDLFYQYVYLRAFGFGELRQGNLALWNPYLYCGVPNLSQFESALLYPLNLVFLILPLAKAVNVSIALHVFLLGYFTYLWTYYRGLHPLASGTCGCLIMFGGALFGHVYAGHLSNLCTMPWVPLLFLSIDGFFDHRSPGWLLLGTGAIAMMVLAGHPQYVYYTAIAATLYCGLNLIRARNRAIIIGGLFAMCVGGVAISAIQTLPGIITAGDSVRSGGVAYWLAATYSFPPENFLTLIAPFFFGPIGGLAYWGRYCSWEMTFFTGSTAVVLLAIACFYGDPRTRRFSISMLFMLLILALGRYTPLFSLLYHWLPGFNMFRGCSKFIFLASLFLILLAGIGLDHIFRSGGIHRAVPIVVLFAAALFAGIAWWIYLATWEGQGQSWARVLGWIANTKEYLVSKDYFSAPDTIMKSGRIAYLSLLTTSGALTVIGILLAVLRSGKALAYALAVLAVAEVFTFARLSYTTWDLSAIKDPVIERVLAQHQGDDRTLNIASPNNAMIAKVGDIWGYSPAVSKRYAEFMTFTQKANPDEATQSVDFIGLNNLYRMLRLRHAFYPTNQGTRVFDIPDPMPRLQLMTDFTVATQRNEIFSILDSRGFDPTKTVVLERQPNPVPVPSNIPGLAKITDSSTDHLTIEVDVAQPAVLLITDGYSKDWRVDPLPGSVQQQYELMPANYVLRAVPLAAGHHLFRMEYAPIGFTVGKWVSLVSIAGYIALTIWWLRAESLHQVQRQGRNIRRADAADARCLPNRSRSKPGETLPGLKT